MNENITPLPCPFCGGEVEFVAHSPDELAIECVCSAQVVGTSKIGMLKLWNNRPAVDPLTARVKELERIVRQRSATCECGNCLPTLEHTDDTGLTNFYLQSMCDQCLDYNEHCDNEMAALNKEPTT